MKLEDLKQGFDTLWDSAADGWSRLRRLASGALTSFTPGDQAKLPARGEVDDDFYLPSQGWSMLSANVFEDDKRVVVRVEVPGIQKENIDIEVVGDSLVVRGEKRFERESSDGRYRLFQQAYGRFSRMVRLPEPVRPEHAKATYKDGVLKIELPKAVPGKSKKRVIKVA